MNANTTSTYTKTNVSNNRSTGSKVFLAILIIVIIGSITVVSLLLAGVFDEDTPAKDLPIPDPPKVSGTTAPNGSTASDFTLPTINPSI